LIIGDPAPRRAAAAALRSSGLTVEDAASFLKVRTDLTHYDVLLLAYTQREKLAAALASLSTMGAAPPILILSQQGAEAGLVAEASAWGGGRDIVVVSGLEDLVPRLSYVTRRGRSNSSGNDNLRGIELTTQIDELRGAKVLIVDDDIRNIYSLTSVLETYGVEVLHAERGRDGISILEQTPDIDVALIDIMMPEMDGYETMQQIRTRPQLAGLPIVAVTAKAMKGDRQKCLDAGASDYIAKPVDVELMLALLRVWIARARSEPLITGLITSVAE
jgi:CheY-like chemotaxis protein